MILLVLFNFLLAIIFIFTKKLSFIASPAFFTGIRFCTAGVFFLSIKKGTLRSFIEFVTQEIRWIFYVAVGFAGGDILRTQALQLIPSSHASLLATGAPFIALIISYFLLNESITHKKIAGLIIGISGLMPLLINKVINAQAPIGFMISYIFFVFSIVLLVIGAIYSKKLSTKGYDLRNILAAVMTGAGIVGISISIVTDVWSADFFGTIVENWFLVISLIVIQNICGFYLYNYLVKRYPVTVVTFFNLLIPLFTSILLWWYQLEKLDYEFFLAFIMLIIGFIVLMVPIPKKWQN